LNAALHEVLIDRTGGNPLFVEELASFLRASGHIETTHASPTEGVGELSLGTLESAAAVPTSLEGLLLERIDRLGKRERALLRVASVVGRTFDIALVEEVAGVADAALVWRDLEAQDLVFSSASGSRFNFKHALLRDAIYGSVLLKDRAALHLEIARAIERRNAQRTHEVANELAHHYSKTDAIAETVHYLYIGAQRSHKLFALGEVELRLRAALVLIEANPRVVEAAKVLDVLLLLARLLIDEGAAGLISNEFAPYRDLAEAADPIRRGRFTVFYGFSLSVSGSVVEGKAMLTQALALAEATGEAAAIAQASLWTAMHYAYWDDASADAAKELQYHAERGIDYARRAGDGWIEAYCLNTLAVEAIGTPSRCRLALDRLIELDRSRDVPLARQLALIRQ
jgi:predicted ATPase